MENFKVGSILINTSSNKLYGVLVTTLPNNKIIVFRLDKDTHPIFSKFEIHPHIAKVGIINEHQYASLKSALLKHYRTYNLTPSEKQMLKPLMEFAFPIGIPEYQPNVELPERDIQLMDLHSKLTPGNRIFINTPIKSSYNHLDGKTVDVIEKAENGVWVNLPNGESDMTKLGNSIYFLFYKNKEVPTFGGISRISPVSYGDFKNKITIGTNTNTNLINDDDLPKINEVIAEAFKGMKERDELTTLMEFNGEKVRVIPKTYKIIFPEVFQNMLYNPNHDSFTIEKGLITASMASKLGSKLMVGGKDSKGNIIEFDSNDNELIFNNDNNLYGNLNNNSKYEEEVKIGVDGELYYGDGGGRKKKEHGNSVSDNTMSSDSNELDSILDNELEEINKSEKLASKFQYESINNKLEHNIDDIDDADVEDFMDDEEISKRSRDFIIDEDGEFEDYFKPNLKTDLKQNGNIKGEFGELISDRLTPDSQGKSEDETGNESRNETDIETDEYDEESVEIVDESEIQELDTFEKVKRVEVGLLEKVFKESIQKGDLKKYKLEQIPYLLRNDPVRINKIQKQINIISLLKHKLTGDDNNIKFSPQDYKPLVSKYISGDFTNKFLIPLVINRKKIYLDKAKKGQKDEYDAQTHDVIEDYYENIKNSIYLQDKKNISLNNDTYLNNIINSMNPSSISESEALGFLFRLGSKISIDDYSKLCQDTLTIKYCDKPMKCQSYSLNPMNFDYQVNIGPIGRFIDEEEYNLDVKIDINLDEEEREEQPDKDILYSTPRFKTYYEGDTINIIGYVRPPLKYFNSPDETLLANLYNIQKQHNEIVTVNLSDINPEIIDEDLEEQFSITQNPDHFVLFLLPQEGINVKEIEKEITKIIPSIDDLIKLYMNNKKQNSITYIYNVLDKFEYDYRDMTIDIYNKINEKNMELSDIYSKFNDKMTNQFETFSTKRLKEKEETEKSKKDKKNMKGDAKFKYITDDIMDEISKFYFETYENKGISIDSDDIRLRWFVKSFDNGRYFFKTLFMNYLKMYQETRNLENLETEMAIIKEKHAMTQNNIQMQEQTNKMDGTSDRYGSTESCEGKITGPTVIKYPSLARLEQDNGKVAVDSDGNVIMMGDYALVDVNNSKQLFKREIIGNIDMWIKEDIGVLYKIIQDKKSKCIANPEMKLDDANKCTFDLENLKCEPTDIMNETKYVFDMELQINDLQKEIDYIKKIPRSIAILNKDITSDRLNLVNKLNSMKNYWKFREEEEIKIEEQIKKTIITKKPCVHFNVTDYFYKIQGSDDNRYSFAQSIFKNFQNNEIEYDHDFHKYDRINNENNHTFCNICNQHLLCNHFRLGVSYLDEDKSIDYDNIISVFGTEINGSYYCKVCSESIGTTEILDLDDFGGGEDGYAIKTREISPNTPYIEKQKEYIDKMIDGLLEGESTIQKEELDQRLTIFNLIKKLSNIDILNIRDEIDMLNFVKSFSFETKTRFLALLVSKIGTGNPALLKKKMEQFYVQYMIADIGARFLITLQTSSTNYNIYNSECGSNFIGYPLINDLSAIDGINYIMCLFSQMAIIPEYSMLADLQQKVLIDRLKKQVDDDSFVKDKIYDALNRKSNAIENINNFDSYYTNWWKTFKPRLEHINLNWQSEKILNSANLKEITVKNWGKMIEVGRENCMYYSLSLMDIINRIIENQTDLDKTNGRGLNYCCADSYNSEKAYNYMSFFKGQNSDITKNMKSFKEIENLLHILEGKKRYPIQNIIYEPLYKPSQKIFPISFNVSADEIKDIYLKFIDNGFNKGKLHIYDKYGRCILSNEKKKEISDKSYSIQDYKRIEKAINTGNQINVKKYFEGEFIITDIKKLEINKVTELIDKCPKLEIMKYIKDYLIKINESFDEIFDKNDKIKSDMKSDIKNKKTVERFDIHRHLGKLNSQIEFETNGLVKKLTTIEKTIDKYEKILLRLGDFTNLYNEYKENHTVNESNLYRYNKKEEHIQTTLKFLNDVMNQIKNNMLSNPLDKERIRPQFRDFLSMGENIKLFKMLGVTTREIYDFARLLKSKNAFKILFPEMVSSLLQYLNIISLVNLFDILDVRKIASNASEIVEYKFKVVEETDDALKDYNRELSLDNDFINGNNYGNNYNEINDINNDEEVNFIESFEIKNSNNLKIINSFITTYLDNINDIQNTYNELTNKHIKEVVTSHNQKLIEATLKGMEWLSKEGHESEKQLVFLKMHKLKKINYAGLAEHLQTEYGDIYDDGDKFNENDEYDGDNEIINVGDNGADGADGTVDNEQNNDYERQNNELGLDKYEQAEMAQVFDDEENEDGDQDYGFLAGGDGDD